MKSFYFRKPDGTIKDHHWVYSDDQSIKNKQKKLALFPFTLLIPMTNEFRFV